MDLSQIIVSIFILFIFYKLWKIHNGSFYKLASKIPGPLALPLTGNCVQIYLHKKGILDYLIEYQKKYGKTTRHWMGTKLYIYITCPDDVMKCLKEISISTSSPLYNILEPLTEKVLFNLKGKQWKIHHDIIERDFTNPSLESYSNMIDEKATTLRENLLVVVNKEIDIFPYIQNFLSEVLIDFSFGIKISEHNLVETMMMEQLRKFYNIFSSKNYWPIIPYGILIKLGMKLKKFYFSFKLLYYLKCFILNRELLNCFRKKGTKSVLNFLISNINDDFNKDEAIDEAAALEFAGHSPTVAAVCYSMYLLARHQNIQEKLHKEIKRNLGKNEMPSLEKLQNCTYLDKVIKEVLRIRPPVPFYSRELENNLQLTKHCLPSKSVVNIFTYMIHHDPEIYPNPDIFDPERFSKENIDKRHPCAFIPFGFGERNCIGQKVACLIMKIALVKILPAYELHPGEEIEKHNVFFALNSSNGFKIRLRNRNSN